MPHCPTCGHYSAKAFEFCARCGSPTATVASREQRKRVTVLFCDVIASTELGEGLDPESLRRMLTR